jgi:hypothetical protein
VKKIRGKIRIFLREEFFNRSIAISESSLEKVVDSVLAGNFSLRVIYDDATIGDFQYIYEEHFTIDYNKFKISEINKDLVSIDGGIRFQWNKREVIIIDKSLIREWKLNQICNL